MKLVIQRVRSASVSIGNEVHAEIGAGLLIFLGIHIHDTQEDIDWYVHKVINMRIFGDEKGKMNLSVQDVNAEIFIVSQFTLYGEAERGNRPSFIQAARPETARPLYDAFIRQTSSVLGSDRVKSGIFGADMEVSLVNDGPVTILL